MRANLKRLAEQSLVSLGPAKWAASRIPPSSTLVLAYHNIVADRDPLAGDTSLHLRQSDFARQLDVLARDFEVIPLGALAQESISGRLKVAVTFDDAYAGALTLGVRELALRRLPGTVFVAPALLSGVTWWDQLSTQAERAVPAPLREHALHSLGGRGNDILDWARSSGFPIASPATVPHIGTEKQLADASTVEGIRFGSHTWSHVNTAATPHISLESELAKPLQWLRERFDNVIPSISFPYGLFSPQVSEACRAAGYDSAYRIDGGWVFSDEPLNPMAIPRYNVPAGLTAAGFRLRLSGLLLS